MEETLERVALASSSTMQLPSARAVNNPLRNPRPGNSSRKAILNRRRMNYPVRLRSFIVELTSCRVCFLWTKPAAAVLLAPTDRKP